MSLLNGLEDPNLNPLKFLRLQTGRSPELFAKDAGIRLAAVGQAEEGFYPNPLPAYLLALEILPGTRDELAVTEAYHEYQTTKRISNGPKGEPKLITVPQFRSDEHPLLTWRIQSGLSTYGFCSAYCVHMPSVNNFERNILNITRIPPVSISEPLREAGYDLEEFTEAANLFKAGLLNQSRALNGLPLVV